MVKMIKKLHLSGDILKKKKKRVPSTSSTPCLPRPGKLRPVGFPVVVTNTPWTV